MSEVKPERQFTVEKMNVQVFADKQLLGKAAAEFVIQQLKDALNARGEANLIVATGNSQFEFLQAFRQEQALDWSKITVFHLDEYLGISDQHPASFRLYLQNRLFDHVPFGTVHLLNGDSDDPQAECKRYADLMSGIEIDVACIGIGENGHLAFNDPPADFETPELVHIVELDEACRKQQVGEGYFATVADVPSQALSLSIPAILSAKAISCVTPDQRKADAVHCALEGEITPMCPASILRTHAGCHLFLDIDSASRLSG